MGGRKCVLCFPPLQQPEHRNQIQRDKKEYRPFGQQSATELSPARSCYRTKYARRAAEFHIPRAPKEKKTGGRGDRRKASAKSRAIVFSYRSEITRLYDNSHKITPLYSCTLTLGRLICQQKHQCIRFNFCMKLKIRFLSPSRKAETARGSFPCCCKRNKSLSSGPLGRKKTQAHLQNFQLFTHMKGSVQERPGESIIFTEIGCFLSLFSVKRRKGLPCPLGENTVYYFVKYLYTGVACPV